MNPIYKFTLSINGATPGQVYPAYGDDLAKEFTMESNEMFFRAKLSGDLTFVGPDFTTINSAAFDAKFSLVMYISYDRGTTWTEYWRGKFYKTDCDFDADDRNVVVKPQVDDDYEAVIAGMDKEYSLIELAPECVSVNYDKRPLVQVYVPGEEVIGCFLSNMWWEQECESVLETDMYSENETRLHHLGFYPATKKRSAYITDYYNGATLPVDSFIGNQPDPLNGPYTLTNGSYSFVVEHEQLPSGGTQRNYYLKQGDTVLYTTFQLFVVGSQPTPPPIDITLSAATGSGAVGSVRFMIRDIAVYSRMLADKISDGTHTGFAIPNDDMVDNNRNYKYAIGYNFEPSIIISNELSTTATKWGNYQPGRYYIQPFDPNLQTRLGFPVSRGSWTRTSIWYKEVPASHFAEVAWRTPSVLKDAYPLSSAISVLLGQIAPSITHQNNENYSHFLYETNPISGVDQTIIIAPKSNVVNAGYDEPAQKAMVKLSDITDMLRDCFRCYWFLDNGKFRIEHIEYFRNGGSYERDVHVVGVDLTADLNVRSMKNWAYMTSKYKFSKPEMAARYEFGWMDDVTEPFEGNPIDIISGYVNPDNVQKIDVAQFTSDIDYILLNPNAVSKDGFALLAAATQSGEYVLPYYSYTENSQDYYLQNAWVSFRLLQTYYLYDMPAKYIKLNGVQFQAYGVKRLKTQEVNFPALYDVDVSKLVKTNLGDGEIQKISINLSSRNAKATLMYDTEQ